MLFHIVAQSASPPVGGRIASYPNEWWHPDSIGVRDTSWKPASWRVGNLSYRLSW